MKLHATATLLAISCLGTSAFADGRNPGSVLVYPVHRTDTGNVQAERDSVYFTILSVTNSNLNPAAGSTNVHFEYLNTVFFNRPSNRFKPDHCTVIDRVENLTPMDTLSVLTSCHNAASGQEGYVVVSAQDPGLFKTNWSFNYLMGSEMIVTGQGGFYSLNAIPFSSPVAEGGLTDLDFDGQVDFDGLEYEGIADTLYIDSFLAVANSSLCLINLTGGTDFVTTVQFDIWNDNEIPLSSTLAFKCWFEEPLYAVSLIFDQDYLRYNTNNDEDELDIDCDGQDDVETGWAMINGLVTTSTAQAIGNPALLGALTAGPMSEGGRFFDASRLLWESADKQFNGDFLKVGSVDPEN